MSTLLGLIIFKEFIYSSYAFNFDNPLFLTGLLVRKFLAKLSILWEASPETNRGP